MIAVEKRWLKRLSRLYTAGIGCMLAALSLYGYASFARQLDIRSGERFANQCVTLCSAIASQPDAGTEWLEQMASSHNMLIAVEKNGVETMRSNAPAPSRALDAAREEAAGQYGYDHAQKPGLFLGPEIEVFAIRIASAAYRVCLAKIWVDDDWFSFTILMDRSDEQAQLLQMRRIFAAGALAAMAILAVMAQLFTARAVRPMADGQACEAQLISAISHEMQSPLSNIQANAEKIARTSLEEARQLARSIEKESSRLSCLAKDLFHPPTQPEQGGGGAASSADPAFVLLTLFERYERSAKEKGVGLCVHVPEHALPKVQCDGQSLQQALCVLVDNALRHTPAGGRIHLQVERHRRFIVFAVADSGAGIPRGGQQEGFQRFYRAGPGEEGRCGLDLSIALKFVLLHGGQLLVEDSGMGGAAYTVRIPI